MADRIEQLDSLRGLAALSVVLHHHLLACPGVWAVYRGTSTGGLEAILLWPPVSLLWSGHSAVVLFFLLSGYVLALPVLQGQSPPYHRYLVKRCLRIYVPYLAAVSGSMLAATLLVRGRVPGLSDWFRLSWAEPVTRTAIRDHLILIKNFHFGQYNNVIWSLIHEMRISLYFPLVALAVSRWHWGWSLASALALSLVGCLVPEAREPCHRFRPYGLTLHYTAFFLLGAVLAKHRRPIAGWLERRSLRARVGLAAAALLLYSSNGWSSGARIGPWKPLFECTTAAGATVLIVFATTATWLKASGFVWLGRISYSLYLWHLPVLLAMVHIGYGRAPSAVLIVASLPLGLGVATVMHRIIEVPTIALGRRIGRNPGPRPHLRSQPIGPSTGPMGPVHRLGEAVRGETAS